MAFIKAISYYLPEKELTNAALQTEFPEWSAEKVAAKVGVDVRHICTPEETAGDLAEKAALKLFQESDIRPSEIDFVLLCTQSPDYHLPTTACVLQHRLGIPTSAGALDYNLGCSGCIYGMAVAKGLIAAGIAHNVLLLTAETYSKYLYPEDKSNRSIFGDGAAACLIASSADHAIAAVQDFVLGTDGSGADHLIVRTGASRQPGLTGLSEEDEEGHIRRDDFLYMNGSAVFNFTLETVPQLIQDTLSKHHLSSDAIDYYIFHQANKFMLSTLRKCCAIPKDKFYIDLSQTGNTVSSTILIGLKKCLDSHTIQSGQQVMVAGFGVGLSWGATILRML